MSKNNWMSAAELMAQLQQDPNYLAQQAERERARSKREAIIKSEVAPILEDLRNVGVAVHEWADLSTHFLPLPGAAIRVLLSWLPRVSLDSVKEMVARALAGTLEPYDGSALVHAFEATGSDVVRWAVANTMAVSNPEGIGDWIVRAVTTPSFGKAREMLAIAVARLAPPTEANRVLIPLLAEFPGHAAQGLALSGGLNELVALESMRSTTKGWHRKEITKAIKAIQNRLDG